MRALLAGQKKVIEQNNQLLMPENTQLGDYRTIRYDNCYDDSLPTQPEAFSMKKFIRSVFKKNKQYISQNELSNVLQSLGLARIGTTSSKDAKKDDVAQGIRTLIDLHFCQYNEKERSDILGEMLFNARIFTQEASTATSLKTTRSIASCIFNVSSLLKTIDSTAGSLNDTAVQEYAEIENLSPTSSKRGYGILKKGTI